MRLHRAAAVATCLTVFAVVAPTAVATPPHRVAQSLGTAGRSSTPVGRAKPSGQPRYVGPNAPLTPWTQITNVPSGFVPGSMLLGLDGSVYVHQDNTGVWYRLTPDSTGSYATGTWKKIATMPAGYQPEYFASQILSDGRMLIEGGEYNGSGTEVWTSLGAIYKPTTNRWTPVNPPTGWSDVGDAQSVLLANGKFMMGHIDDTQDAVFTPSTLTWTVQPGTGKVDRNDEEGYQLLPNGKVLTVNDEQALANPGSPGSQVYTAKTGAWSNAGTLPVLLAHSPDEELGPMVLRPDGSVFAVGATSNTALYSGGAWTAGPTLPNGYDSADGPAAILPNGDVLLDASPGIFNTPTHFWVYNGSTVTQIPDTTFAPNDSTYYTRMLVLPTGQVLFDDTQDMEIYTPSGTAAAGVAPTISSLSATSLARGGTFSLSGTQLAGRSTGAGYGDDAQDNTNYPLVRITNDATGVVTYARTKSMTSHSVAPGVASSTKFVVATSTPTGPSHLVVVANGIASAPQAVTIS
jgi:hypothetical protein